MNKDNKNQKIVATAFIHNNGKLFIARRASTKSFLPDVFELPGGHIEFGETMEEGLAREIKEEFNVNVKIGKPFNVFTYMNANNTQHTVEVNYFVTMIDSIQDIELNPNDHSEYLWVMQDDFLNFFNGNEAEGEAAKKGFSMLSDEN